MLAFQYPFRPEEDYSSRWKLVYNFNQVLCYRDYQLATKFNQQNEKSTSNWTFTPSGNVCVHPIIHSKQMCFCIFFWLSWKSGLKCDQSNCGMCCICCAGISLGTGIGTGCKGCWGACSASGAWGVGGAGSHVSAILDYIDYLLCIYLCFIFMLTYSSCASFTYCIISVSFDMWEVLWFKEKDQDLLFSFDILDERLTILFNNIESLTNLQTSIILGSQMKV